MYTILSFPILSISIGLYPLESTLTNVFFNENNILIINKYFNNMEYNQRRLILYRWKAGFLNIYWKKRYSFVKNGIKKIKLLVININMKLSLCHCS